MSVAFFWECHRIPTDFQSIIFQRGRAKNHQPEGIPYKSPLTPIKSPLNHHFPMVFQSCSHMFPFFPIENHKNSRGPIGSWPLVADRESGPLKMSIAVQVYLRKQRISCWPFQNSSFHLFLLFILQLSHYVVLFVSFFVTGPKIWWFTPSSDTFHLKLLLIQWHPHDVWWKFSFFLVISVGSIEY